MLKILFLGLCMFVKNADGGRTVVIPDISAAVDVMTPRGATCVEPHIAYISAAEADVVSCSGCELRADEDNNEWQLLYLKGDTVEIAGLDGKFEEDDDYNKEIPHISKYCPQFRLAIPATATTLPLRNGTLKAECDCGECDKCAHARVSYLEAMPHANITITARRGDVVRVMVIKHLDTPKQVREVNISNRYAAGHLRSKTIPPLAENHWLAFYTLGETPVVCDLPTKSGLVETTLACSNSGYP